MINTYTIDALSGQHLEGGKYKLTLDRSQEEELYAALTNSLRIDMVKARTFFFDKEGYMASDRDCITYWIENYEGH